MTSERKKQWVLLTNEIVSKDEETVRRSHKNYVAALARYVGTGLGDHPSACAVAEEFQAAVEPHINIILALNH